MFRFKVRSTFSFELIYRFLNLNFFRLFFYNRFRISVPVPRLTIRRSKFFNNRLLLNLFVLIIPIIRLTIRRSDFFNDLNFRHRFVLIIPIIRSFIGCTIRLGFFNDFDFVSTIPVVRSLV